jgi:hypothetical protein
MRMLLLQSHSCYQLLLSLLLLLVHLRWPCLPRCCCCRRLLVPVLLVQLCCCCFGPAVLAMRAIHCLPCWAPLPY